MKNKIVPIVIGVIAVAIIVIVGCVVCSKINSSSNGSNGQIEQPLDNSNVDKTNNETNINEFSAVPINPD